MKRIDALKVLQRIQTRLKAQKVAVYYDIEPIENREILNEDFEINMRELKIIEDFLTSKKQDDEISKSL